ncbi:MAG: hypothetical protein LBK05_06630, partial [Treponema sp.]|nr:hypothetical protein [Treponema sp.]
MIRKYMIRACAGILFLFMGSIFLRFFTLNILIEKLHIHNTFTRTVFFDKTITDIAPLRSIKWERFYPFSTAADTITNKASGLKQRIDDIKNKIELYTKDNLTNRLMFIELAIQYEQKLGWNILHGDVVDLG